MRTSTDENVNPHVLNELEKKLRRFSLHSKLETCRKVYHIINPYIKNSKFDNNTFEDINSSKDMYPKNFREYKKICPLHEIAYISLMSAVCGEWKGYLDDFNKFSDFRKIINLYREYLPPYVHKNDKELAKMKEGQPIHWNKIRDPFFLRLALQQFKYQENQLINLYRYNYLFSFEHGDMNMKEIFNDVFGHSYDDFIKFATILYLLSNLTLSELTINKIRESIWDNNLFSSSKTIDMLKKLSMDRNIAIKKYNHMKSNDERMKIYNYNPFTMKPILLKGENVYLPVPILLFRAITEGFYHMICYKKKEINFRANFGKKVFEPYVEHVLEWNDPEYKIIPEFEYINGNDRLDSPDFILVKDNDLIFIEVKATAPSIKLKSTDMSEYIDQLYKGYGNGIIQCIKKDKHIRDRILGHSKLPSSVNKIYYLVVTLEKFYMPITDFMKSNIEKMCEEEGVKLPENKKFHIISIETLENIRESSDENIFDYLEERENQSKNHRKTAWPDSSIESIPSDSKMINFWQNTIKEIESKLF